jgi:hypothetical protein
MNLSTFKQALILSALSLAGAAALADDITLTEPGSASTRSRAEVRAELQQAIADGSLIGGGELALQSQRVQPNAPSPLTRAQVRRQAAAGAPTLSAMLASHGAP